MAKLGRSVCPVPPLDPVAREEGRRRAVADLAGDKVSPSRPALGFELGATTEAEVRTWIITHQLSCDDARGGSTVSCSRVPDAAVPEGSRGAEITRASFRFDVSSRLVAVVLVRDALGADVAVSTFTRGRDALSQRLGPPTRSSGEVSAEWLAGGDLRQARVEHRFSNYFAALAATRIGRTGVALTEEYQLIVSDPSHG